MCEILRGPSAAGLLARDTASLPLALGGLGLRSASRSRQSAHWASWADTLPMVRSRHRATAEAFVEVLEKGVGPVSLVAAEDCRRNLTGVMGFEPPSWSSLCGGARPPPPPLDDTSGWRTGWQHEAASRVDRHFRDSILMPRLDETAKALVRSQSGPMSGAALSAAPTYLHTHIKSHLFHLLLLPSPTLCSRLSLWLPLGLLWPPSCSVFTGGLACSAWFHGGDGCGTSVPRSSCAGHDRLGSGCGTASA